MNCKPMLIRLLRFKEVFGRFGEDRPTRTRKPNQSLLANLKSDVHTLQVSSRRATAPPQAAAARSGAKAGLREEAANLTARVASGILSWNDKKKRFLDVAARAMRIPLSR